MAVESAAGHFVRPANFSTPTVVTGLGFQPTCVIFLVSNVLTANTWRAEMTAGIGWAAPRSGNSVPTPVTFSMASNDASTAPEAHMFLIYGRVWITDKGGSFDATGGVSFQSDGFTIEWDAGGYDGEQEHIGYLALGGDVQAATISASLPIGALEPGDAIFLPGQVPFLPQGGMLLAMANFDVVNRGIKPSIGMVGSSAVGGSHREQWAISYADETDADPSDAYGRLSTDEAIHLLNPATGATDLAIRITDWTPQGLAGTVISNALTDPGDTLQFNALCLGGEGVQLNAATFARSTGAAPAAQAVPVPHGTPLAALFATVSHTALNATQPHARGSFGVSDGTNNRAVAWQWADNVGTSSGDTYFSDANALLVADNSTPAVEGATPATFDLEEINLVWNPNN